MNDQDLLIEEIKNVPMHGNEESLIKVLTALSYWATPFLVRDHVNDLVNFCEGAGTAQDNLEELLGLLDAADVEDAKKIIAELKEEKAASVEPPTPTKKPRKPRKAKS
jgi:hypothetical protein